MGKKKRTPKGRIKNERGHTETSAVTRRNTAMNTLSIIVGAIGAVSLIVVGICAIGTHYKYGVIWFSVLAACCVAVTVGCQFHLNEKRRDAKQDKSKSHSFQVLVNTVDISKYGELHLLNEPYFQIVIKNITDISIENVWINFAIDISPTNFNTDGWQLQPGFAEERNGGIILRDDLTLWRHGPIVSLGAGSLMAVPVILFTNAAGLLNKPFNIEVGVRGAGTKQERFPIKVIFTNKKPPFK